MNGSATSYVVAGAVTGIPVAAWTIGDVTPILVAVSALVGIAVGVQRFIMDRRERLKRSSSTSPDVPGQ